MFEKDLTKIMSVVSGHSVLHVHPNHICMKEDIEYTGHVLKISNQCSIFHVIAHLFVSLASQYFFHILVEWIGRN